MLPQFLMPETTVREAGQSPDIDLGTTTAGTLVLTMGITRIIEQQSIDVSIWGSADGETWSKKPLLKLPQQFYRGTTKMVLDISLRPEVKFIRAHWDLNRWGRVAPTPMFVAGLEIVEVPPMSRETPTKRMSLATS